ncbi:MAG: hypothetical protein IKP20_02340 [Candidatus Methanomethylophilaceae archaeon]|nr:hypothetical protein [Candidatus Methanomethylophilaceae archaeon]
MDSKIAMSIVKMKNKKTGVTYVYESTSYWDKEKRQPRNKRRLIGKLDPATGEIVPTGRREPAKGPVSMGGGTPEPSDFGPDMGASIDEREAEILELRKRVLELEIQLGKKTAALERIRRALDSCSEREHERIRERTS